MDKEKQINQKEVYEALLLLQEICKTSEKCQSCVFFENENNEDYCCGLASLSPDKWVINKPPEYDFKFFAKRGD